MMVDEYADYLSTQGVFIFTPVNIASLFSANGAAAVIDSCQG